jgi:hypothetical protein
LKDIYLYHGYDLYNQTLEEGVPTRKYLIKPNENNQLSSSIDEESQIKLKNNNQTDLRERLKSAVHRIEGLARAFVSEF